MKNTEKKWTVGDLLVLRQGDICQVVSGPVC